MMQKNSTPWNSHWAMFLVLLLAVILSPSNFSQDSKGDWWSLESDHFSAIGDAPKRDAMKVLENVETLRTTLLTINQKLDQDSPIPVKVVVLKSKSFAHLRDILGIQSKNTAGLFFSGPLNKYIVIDCRHSSRTAFHEYVHFVIDNNIPDLPVWLDEGLAELYSTFKSEKGDVKIGIPIPNHIRIIREKALIPLGEFFQVDRNSPQYNETERSGMFYAQSWLVVHYLFFGGELAAEGLPRFLAHLSDGWTTAKAFESAFGLSMVQFEDMLLAYSKKKTFPYLRHKDLAPPEISLSKFSQLSKTQQSVQMGHLALANDTARSKGEALRFLEAGLSSPSEKSDALAGLGYFYSREGDIEQARKYLNLALETAPEAPRICFLHGLSILQLIEAEFASQEDMQTEILQARSRFLCALAKYPTWAEARAGLGFTYGLIEDEDVSPGILALVKAAKMMPESQNIWAHLTQLYVLSSQGELAEKASLRAQAGDDKELAITARDLLFLLVYDQVNALIETQNLDQALILLTDARDKVQSPEMKKDFSEEIERLTAANTDISWAQQITQAYELANSGKTKEALQLFQNIAANAPNPKMRADASEMIASLIDFKKGNQDVQQFNRAIEMANKGDFKSAIPILENILRHSGVDDLKMQAKTILQDLKAHQRKANMRDDFNRALKLIEKGEKAQAKQILERLAGQKEDTEISFAAKSVLEKL